jgi:hypothetical protein
MRYSDLFAREIGADYRGFRIVVQNTWAADVIPAFISEGFEAARKAPRRSNSAHLHRPLRPRRDSDSGMTEL